jgi:hypothetical protein
MKHAKRLLEYAIEKHEELIADTQRLSYDVDYKREREKIDDYREALNFLENWEIFNEL